MNALWYMASPYRHYPYGKEAAARDAARCAGLLLDAGLLVFSPIAHSHLVSSYTSIPQDADDWLLIDQGYMERCDGIIVAKLPTWDTSAGVTFEVGWFLSRSKPILYFEPRSSDIHRPGSGRSLSTADLKELSRCPI